MRHILAGLLCCVALSNAYGYGQTNPTIVFIVTEPTVLVETVPLPPPSEWRQEEPADIELPMPVPLPRSRPRPPVGEPLDILPASYR